MAEQPSREDFDKAAKAAADLFVYAPIGIAREVSKQLPDFVRSGRELVAGPLAAAKVMGKFAMNQQRQKAGERIRDAAAPYFGGDTQPGAASPQPQHADHSVDPRQTKATPTPEGAPNPDGLAIENYNTLSASQILAHLTELDDAQLAQIEAYETATRARKTILARVSQLRSR